MVAFSLSEIARILGLGKGSPIQVSLASSAIIRAGAPALQYRSFATSRRQVRPTSQHLGRKRGSDLGYRTCTPRSHPKRATPEVELKTQGVIIENANRSALPGSGVSCFQTVYESFFGSVRESKLIRSMICVSLTGLLTYA